MAAPVSVALPLPVQTTFTYLMPEGQPVPERGVRVLVPFGSRRVIGMVTGAAEPGDLKLKHILDVVDEAPLVLPPLLDLAGWIADHYLAPPGSATGSSFHPRAFARVVPWRG